MSRSNYKNFKSCSYTSDSLGTSCDARQIALSLYISFWLMNSSVKIIDIHYYDAYELDEKTNRQEHFIGAHVIYEDLG